MNPSHNPLANLWQHPQLRRAASVRPRESGIATGNPHLDARLHWRGWPRGALTELLGTPGQGELSLLAPALSRLARGGGHLFLVDPPHPPHAPGLQQLGIPWERLLVVRTTRARDPIWACEQILRSGTCAALLCWEGVGSWRFAQLLRLQNAARGISGPVFLCRSPAAAGQPSPAVLRLRLTGTATGAALDLVKQPGALGQPLALPAHPALGPDRELASDRKTVSDGKETASPANRSPASGIRRTADPMSAVLRLPVAAPAAVRTPSPASFPAPAGLH